MLFHHDPVHGDDDARSHRACRRGDHSAAASAVPTSSRPTKASRSSSRPVGDRDRSMTAQLHTLNPDPATMRTVVGHFATGVTIVTAMDGDDARRNGVQLVHDGVARTAARALLRGEVLVHVAAHPGGRQVGGQRARRRRRRGVPSLRAEGRRPVRAHDVPTGSERRADPRSRARVRRLRRPRPSTTPATTSSSSAACSSSATSPKASRCSSTAAGTAGTRV